MDLVASPLVTDLQDQLSTLADAGYIVTASTWSGGPNYTLAATRRLGSENTRRSLEVVESDPGKYPGDVALLLDAGFAPVSFTLGGFSLADGGLTLRLIGEK